MNLWRSMMKLPQPVKGCLVAFTVLFAVAFISLLFGPALGQEVTVGVTPWATGALGLCAIVLGVVLATDFRGSARAYASLVSEVKPLGVDYSKTFLSKPLFIRVFGGMFIVVGIGFIVGSLISASQVR